MTKHLITAAMASIITACATAAEPNYTLTVAYPDADADDSMAYLVDYDTSARLDSAIVTDSKAQFTGTVAAPAMVRLYTDGTRGPLFILEPGALSLNLESGVVAGSPLNARLDGYIASMDSIVSQFKALPQDSLWQAAADRLQAEHTAVRTRAFDENPSNPIGLYFFIQDAMEMDLATLDDKVAQYPYLAQSHRVSAMRNALVAKKETSPGHRFKDFTIDFEGTTTRLSDHVGRGNWVLVDFFASWCGPCIRELQTLKRIKADLGTGVQLLGVAVWDEPSDTRAAITRHGIDWPVIIGAQSIPTDLYGIPGIPCIILFDPEGNIVCRDLQGDDLYNFVKKALEAAAAADPS